MGKGRQQKIEFHYLNASFYFPNRTLLKRFIVALFKKEGKRVGHINYIFCTDDYLLELNKKHLNHNTYTDIITFPYSGKGEPILSDIYISVERVRENAKSFDSSFKHELYRVIFHGALHLCGFKDKTPADLKKMRARETFYLDQL